MNFEINLVILLVVCLLAVVCISKSDISLKCFWDPLKCLVIPVLQLKVL